MEWYQQFEHSFEIEDLLVFDDAAIRRILFYDDSTLDLTDLAVGVQGASPALIRHIKRNLPSVHLDSFTQALHRIVSPERIKVARQHILDGLFWELTYWKTPELYDELTEGEHMHPGIFQHLEPDLRGKTVLDIGAGGGRASFECMNHGAKAVYAIEPSPNMLKVLRQKVDKSSYSQCIVVGQGSFDQVPLETDTVDIAISCSAFTVESGQGAEAGLMELTRVTKPGGKIVLIWPRTKDRAWLVAHRFRYITLPVDPAMSVSFRSIESALKCTKYFYASNKAVVSYILEHQSAEIPFSILGIDPPLEYCWLPVD
jgi:ubiquinone/menaquinone biosynthesis C-methylase UbiE